MTFNVNFFLAAVGLLWLPLPYVARRDRSYANRGRVTSSTIPGLWRAWQNWVDLIRSSTGTYALLHLSIGFPLSGRDASTANLIIEGILVVGVLMQTVRFGTAPGFILPLFYLTGITAVMAPPMEAGVAIVMAWVLACGTRDPRFVLPAMSGALLVAGYFLGGFGRTLLMNAALILMPLGLGLLCQKRVVFVSREPKMVYLKKLPIEPVRTPVEPPPENPTRGKNKMRMKSRPSAAGQ